MKKSNLRLLRLLLGGLFVFSGLVKLNDPVGTAIKLEEYFEVFTEAMPALGGFFMYLAHHALTLSLIFCVAEVVLGVAVIIRYRMKVTMWLVLLLIVFFTFLTFYSAYFNKVTDCGCFGDFIKLTPWTSFIKDVVLLVITLVLFARRKAMPNIVHPHTGDTVIGLATVFFFVVGWYATVHLPYADWRPYKVGNIIPVRMKPSAAFKYEYTMERKGEKKVFTEYPDSTWTFVSMKVLNPEAAPQITDYRVWNDEADFTDSTFTGAKLLLVVQSDSGYDPKDIPNMQALINGLNDRSTGPRVDAWILTSLDSRRMETFRHQEQLAAPFFYTDATVLKTIMRTKIGTWLLLNGRVLGKWALKDTPSPQEVRDLVKEVS